MVGVQAALRLLWTDRCRIEALEAVTDPVTKITDFVPQVQVLSEPCRLSFESLSPTNGDPVAAIGQKVKLILRPDLDVPPGCRISVTRGDKVMDFTRSGLPAVYHNHQEILLESWKGWA